MNEVRMKYNEDQIINEIKAYVGLTYEQHYSKSDDGFQVQDVLRHLKINKDFCQANAINICVGMVRKAATIVLTY